MHGRIVVGHALKNDLECLLIGHPKRDIRDTSQHSPFRKLNKGRTPGLKKLAKDLLGIEIQGGPHSSVCASTSRLPPVIHPFAQYVSERILMRSHVCIG